MPTDDAYRTDEFGALGPLLEGRQSPVTHPYWSDAAPCSMHIEEVESIWAAIADQDNWTPFESKIEAIRRMGDAMTSDAPA